MFYQPFNPTTLKVYDLTRSTLIRPYELDYGFSKAVCDRTYYTTMNKSLPMECMLSPQERGLSHPHIFLSQQEILLISEYSLKFLGELDEYHIGYEKGYNDVIKFNYRKTFEEESLYVLSFLVGYEVGIYTAIMSLPKQNF